MAQVRHPEVILRDRRQQPLCLLKKSLQPSQGLNAETQYPMRKGKEITGIGKLDFGLRPFLFERLDQRLLCSCYQLMCATNCPGGYHF